MHKLQQVADQQFSQLIVILCEEGFLLERDQGGWPVRFTETRLVEPQPLER